ncbi:hypothetical protein CAPTEDRAFT_216537 [Capitella teleta]|uniref:G-protein coupled receptors family 1 profile domain-containing protein n=1 Tax=Capitella teleta TaxID=283909 RepID=R7UM58_CAPTE|nr:hypothetical protein CAPTEDRAFT_216537 [Capitella teleta]|eukprot:ELU07173.1 hypothetical protein CAPTEDRAFT_216537 [Capitella teleta]
MTTEGVTTELATSAVVPEQNYRTYWQLEWDAYLMNYAAGVIIFIGVLGNLLTIGVMMSQDFRRSPSSLVLSALALADTGNLVTGLMRWWLFYSFDLAIRDTSSAACKTHMFFTYFFGELSPAILIALTMERFVSVYYPLRCREICSKRRLGIGLIFVTITYALINSYYIFLFALLPISTGQVFCQLNPRYKKVNAAWYWVDSTLYAFLPFVIIFTGNILIAKKLMKAQQSRDTMATKSKKGRQSLTPMLMTVSWCFLFLNLPSCIYFIGVGAHSGVQRSGVLWVAGSYVSKVSMYREAGHLASWASRTAWAKGSSLTDKRCWIMTY